MRVWKVPAVVLAVVISAAGTAYADVPSLLSWQGVALDSTDQPLATGVYQFGFSIWSNDVGGDSLWSETQNVNVETGLMNVLLGAVTPLPDVLFNLPNRWLQVQFESEAPYLPRTQIVSVGYAFRVGSINNATGGQVKSDIELRSQFSVPALRLYREGTGIVIGQMSGGGAGGRMDLWDGSGEPIVEIGPDGDGGGRFTVFNTPSTGISMGNDGADSPEFLMQGFGATLLFDMGATGDNSVFLPVSSVNSEEILDEPGVASSPLGGTVVGIGQTFTDITSATISVPAAGYVVIIAEASFSAQTANTYIAAGLKRDGGGLASWWWDAGDIDSPTTWYDQRQTYVATDFVSGPGTHTYTLNLGSFTAGTVNLTDHKVTCMYFPTAYGAVSTPAPPAPGFDPATAQQAQEEPPHDATAARAQSIAANEARKQRELADMKTRLQELRARFDALTVDTEVR